MDIPRVRQASSLNLSLGSCPDGVEDRNVNRVGNFGEQTLRGSHWKLANALELASR
jgi:hypothetical protein